MLTKFSLNSLNLNSIKTLSRNIGSGMPSGYMVVQSDSQIDGACEWPCSRREMYALLWMDV